MHLKQYLFGLSASLVLLGSSAVAVYADVGNGSFETGTDPGAFTTLAPGSTVIDPWVINFGTIDYIGTYWQASDGHRSLDLNGVEAGSISQEIPTVVGAKYQVSFAMSGNPANAPAGSLYYSPTNKEMTVEATGTAAQSYFYDVSSQTNTLAAMKWVGDTYTFVATSPTTTLTFASAIGGAYGPALDHVVVTQVLPTDKAQCKKDGWEAFGVFKNQGDCVSFVATNGRNLPAGQ